ncbi:MAG: DegV family protein [Clostridia bacterium]|nr:DegV family protein [Clostridia bacterium]
MRQFDIVTDSSCDLPEEYYQKNSVECVNLGFTMNNVNYGGEDGEKIDVKDFYAKLRAGSMPTTYQVTGESAKTHIEKSLKKGRDVLVIAFSSGLSGTAGSFIVAARELGKRYPDRKILVVDSLCASMGEGLLVDYVVKKADSGATIEETRDYAEDLKLHICHNFTVDNLFHLKRGGRVSGATAIVGSILKIKPVMHVNNEGKLVAIGKAMGRKKSLQSLVDNMSATQDLGADDPIFISHGDCIDDVNYLISLINTRFAGHEIKVSYVGSVIGTHSGAGTMALFYKGKHR